MRKEVYICDGCSQQRQASNHWWLAWRGDQEGEAEDCCYTLAPWTDADAEAEGTEHYCGSGCLLQAVSARVGASERAGTKG